MKKSKTEGCCGGVLEKMSPELFKALGDSNRVSILSHLAGAEGPQSVTEVTGCCSVDFSVVSRHLKILKEVGAVTAEKKGKTVFYSLNITALVASLRGLADALEACCPDGTCTIEDREHDK